MDGNGNFVITWDDYVYGGGNEEVFAQRFNSSGQKIGGNFKVNDDTGWAQQGVATIAMDGDGNFAITWKDQRNGVSNPDIYVQRYQNNGAKIGGNFMVNDDIGTAEQDYPNIAMDSNGNLS